jgi:hypothetical protein
MTRLLLLTLLALVAACSITATWRTFDPETGEVTGEFLIRITIDPTEVRTPGLMVKVGEATTPDGGRFEAYDQDGDDKPDLGKDTTTGKFYRITSVEPMNQRRSSPTPMFLVEVLRQDPIAPINDLPLIDGPTLCEMTGFNAITRAGGGTYDLDNALLVYGIEFDGASPLKSWTSIGLRQSSDWPMADAQSFRRLKYEILGSGPAAGATGPHFLVTHVEGPLVEVILWLIQNRVNTFRWTAANGGQQIGFACQGQFVDIDINGARVARIPL